MYIWTCQHDKGASDWRDSYRCLARCRKPFKNESDAKRAAEAHARSTGHSTVVSKRDGRSLRRWK